MDDVIARVGQSFRHVTTNKPVPVLYAVIYWGNSNGDGGITDVFECRIDYERRTWANADMGVVFPFDGQPQLTKSQKEGAATSLYVSPNENDCRIFIAAFTTGIRYVCKPSEEDQTVLHCLVASHMPGREPPLYLFADTLYRGENDEWLNRKGDEVPVDPSGVTHYHMTDGQGKVVMFTSHSAADIRLAGVGVRMMHDLLEPEQEQEPKKEEQPEAGV